MIVKTKKTLWQMNERMKDPQLIKFICHDCGVKEGELHKYGCDSEDCPICGQQLLFCGCERRKAVFIDFDFSLEGIKDRIISEKGISKKELEKRIQEKREELQGLIKEEGAAHIVASELGIDLFKDQKYKEHALPYRIPFLVVPSMCALCGEVRPEFFRVPDDEWKKYVIPELQNKVLCRDCYERLKNLFPNGWKVVKEYDR